MLKCVGDIMREPLIETSARMILNRGIQEGKSQGMNRMRKKITKNIKSKQTIKGKNFIMPRTWCEKSETAYQGNNMV